MLFRLPLGRFSLAPLPFALQPEGYFGVAALHRVVGAQVGAAPVEFNPPLNLREGDARLLLGHFDAAGGNIVTNHPQGVFGDVLGDDLVGPLERVHAVDQVNVQLVHVHELVLHHDEPVIAHGFNVAVFDYGVNHQGLADLLHLGGVQVRVALADDAGDVLLVDDFGVHAGGCGAH